MTLGRVDVLVDGLDDLPHGNVFGQVAEAVAAAGTAGARDEAGAAQLAEDLLEIRHRKVLAFGDERDAHGRLAQVQRQIHHGRHGKATFRRQFHERLLLLIFGKT